MVQIAKVIIFSKKSKKLNSQFIFFCNFVPKCKQQVPEPVSITTDHGMAIATKHTPKRQVTNKKVSRLHPIYQFLSHNKYWIVIIIGVLIVGFLDENSYYQRAKNMMVIRDLKEQIAEFNNQYEHDEALLREFRQNPKAITKIARERYFMKADDEDIFILSDEFIPNQPATHE